MGNRKTKKRTAAAAAAERYSTALEWTAADLRLLEELEREEAELPEDAPRALISVRLSVFTDETTSPVRQELDLRLMARDRRCRVVGVASDLNVSATKVPPWKRKQLGDWLNNRAPEFDEIFFWKMDRFIRKLSDLSTMIDWSLKYGKNLVSCNDSIDLTTSSGKLVVTLIGGLAEIEAENTSTRVGNLWNYTKTQDKWHVGKPSYGYQTAEDEDANIILEIDPTAYRVLHWCQSALKRKKPLSTRRMVKILIRSGLCSPSLTVSTLRRRLRNPGLMGYRVEEDKERSLTRRSKLVLDDNGQPIRVAEPIFTEEEFNEIQKVLDNQGMKQPRRDPAGATEFLGVLKCSDCGTNLTVHKTTTKGKVYKYLRCRNCVSGGSGAPNPDEIYSEVVEKVLEALGNEPVMIRVYREGSEARKHRKQLQDAVTYYMTGLEPDGKFRKTQFTKDRAEKELDKLIAKLEKIDPVTTQDRWEAVSDGKTFRDRWEEGGIDAMSEDLLRIGAECEVKRTKVPGVRAPQIDLKIKIPKDARNLLLLKENDFDNEI